MKKGNNTISSVLKGNTVIDKIIKGTLVVYEAWKKLIEKGIPPLTLLKCKQANLVDYKIDGNSEQSILPNEYQQVEYIEGTGTQWFEINYIASGKTRSKGKFQIMDIEKGAFLFASRGAGGSYFYGLNWGGGKPYKYYNSYMSASLTTEEIDNEIHTFYKDQGTLYIDDAIIGSITYKEFTTPGNMNVLACNENGINGYLPAIARLYNLQFYDEYILKVDLIPCYRKSDNVIGMYDLVNNVFYTNQGTGAFLKGKDAPTPETPIEVESVGDKTKNLFDINTPYTPSKAIDKNGEIVYWGANWGVFDYVGVEPNTTYTRSYDSDTHMGTVIFYDENKNKIDYTVSFGVFTTPSNCKYVRFNIIIRTLPTFMLVKGEYTQEEFEKFTYEPYGYKIPVKVRPNLFDVNNYTLYHYTIDTTEIWSNSSANTIIIPCEVGKTYTISVDYNVTLFRVATVDKIPIDRTTAYNIVRQTNNEPITITAEQPYLCVQLGQSMWNSSIPFLRIETDFITNIYLKEPLRKIKDYTDYIDFEKGKVVRKIYNEYLTSVYGKSSLAGTYTIFLSEVSKKPHIEGAI